MENQTKIKYFLYCRKSSEDKEKQVLSLDSQTTEMKRLANNLGLEVVKTITESKSAKKPNNRPQFDDMVNLIKRGGEKQNYGILCWKIDRLSRNPIDSATIQWLLQTGKLQVIQTMERQYLPSDNVLLFSVESGMANQYILYLSKNVKRGNRTKLEQGGWPGPAPFGYLNDKATKTIIVDTKTEHYIANIFDLYANTTSLSIKDVAEMMYEEGLRTITGKKVYAGSIHRTLNNPFYSGIMVKHGKSYIGKHKPLISTELFNKAKQKLEGNQHPKQQKRFFAFRGFLQCSNCGCALTGETVTKKIKTTGEIKKYNYYRCTNGKGICEAHKKYLSEHNISEQVSNKFTNIAFDEELIDIAYEAKKLKFKSKNDYVDKSRENIDNQLKLTKQKQDRLLDSYLAGLAPQAVYEAKVKDLQNEEVALKNQLKNVKKNDKGSTTLELTKEAFLLANFASKHFLEAKENKKQELLNNLLWNCKIENNEIAKISFKTPFSVIEKAPNKGTFSDLLRDRESNPD